MTAMPTYDYQCDACGHAFEKFQSITASASRKCPECGRLKLRRLIGAGAGVIFRGSGFYQTDYRSSGYQEAAKKDGPPAKSEGAGKDSGKPTEKSATKKDSGGAESPGKKDSG